MILVDSSVWVGHFRKSDPRLTELLHEGEVLTHPLVVGELACGNLRKRDEVLGMLHRLPAAPAATHQEALIFIERHRLMGRGIGYLDVHLLASTALAEDARLWTAETRLASAAARLFLSYVPIR